VELEEELRVVGNNLKSLEVSEEKVHVYNSVKLITFIFTTIKTFTKQYLLFFLQLSTDAINKSLIYISYFKTLHF